MNENPLRSKAEARRRGLLLIWGAQLLSLAFLFFLTYIVSPASSPADGNHTLAWALGAVGFTSFLVSFLVKRKLLAQAAERRRADLGTTAYVIAFAMCELTAILGFVAYLITGLPYALHSFIIAAAGLSLHFPPRGALEGMEGSDAGADLNKTTF
jgi:F0F1-type ATP synthase membrane subunit c/vacuolar-type H+-ATPase subunit K